MAPLTFVGIFSVKPLKNEIVKYNGNFKRIKNIVNDSNFQFLCLKLTAT